MYFGVLISTGMTFSTEGCSILKPQVILFKLEVLDYRLVDIQPDVILNYLFLVFILGHCFVRGLWISLSHF